MQGAKKKPSIKKRYLRKHDTTSLVSHRESKQDRQDAVGTVGATQTVKGDGDAFRLDDRKSETIPYLW
jgi:hypothetical protein